MRSSLAAYIAFAAFGLFWGAWGAALPALKSAVGVSDAQLGAALLCVGVGALPAMALTGRIVDRFGLRTAGAPLIALAVSGAGLAFFATDAVGLGLGMLLVGATSGSADVAANALAGSAEHRSGRRVITLAHAVFSTFVVVGSLGAGALLVQTDALGTTFAICGLMIAAAGITVIMVGDGPVRAGSGSRAGRAPRRLSPILPFAAVGLVGALGFAIENAHQSWSAIFLTDELDVGPLLAALAPATFATFAAATRFAAGILERVSVRTLLVGGAVLAACGTVLLAAAQHPVSAVAGLALAAIGTSVLFPTLLSHATRAVPDGERGRATSVVGTTAYLGFVLGPVYVGLLAGEYGLRAAMVGVAVLALAFGALSPFVGRGSRRRSGFVPVAPDDARQRQR